MHRETVIDRIEILGNGFIQVRHTEYLVEDDGRRTKLRFHRMAYPPGADLSAEDESVRAHAQVAWTPDVRQAHAQRVSEAAARAKRGRS